MEHKTHAPYRYLQDRPVSHRPPSFQTPGANALLSSLAGWTEARR